jgi:hypothetical protein
MEFWSTEFDHDPNCDCSSDQGLSEEFNDEDEDEKYEKMDAYLSKVKTDQGLSEEFSEDDGDSLFVNIGTPGKKMLTKIYYGTTTMTKTKSLIHK